MSNNINYLFGRKIVEKTTATDVHNMLTYTHEAWLTKEENLWGTIYLKKSLITHYLLSY